MGQYHGLKGRLVRERDGIRRDMEEKVLRRSGACFAAYQSGRPLRHSARKSLSCVALASTSQGQIIALAVIHTVG